MSNPKGSDAQQWRVLLFAGVAQALGTREIAVPKVHPCTAQELKALVLAQSQHPDLAGMLQSCRVAVDQDMVGDDDAIDSHAQEIALIPPVSGGIDAPAHDERRNCVLTTAALDSAIALQKVQHENAGGINLFIGQVRRQSRGLVVTHLEYEAYPAMALAAMDRICQGIEADIEGTTVSILHRYGRLEIGEAAVVIAASAPHRAQAFEACRRAIEELKQDVPIWKKEFDDQGGTWIGQGP